MCYFTSNIPSYPPCLEVYDLPRSSLHSLHHSACPRGYCTCAKRLPNLRECSDQFRASALTLIVSQQGFIDIKEYVLHTLETCLVSEIVSTLEISEAQLYQSAKFEDDFTDIFRCTYQCGGYQLAIGQWHRRPNTVR
jgi:hypothetical protein